MKNFEFIKKGRKIVFSLALFILVFAAASAVKIQAAGNVTGWLWGGSEDANIGGSLNTWPPDGNETGVGEIHMSGTAQDGSPYGVNIPSSDGLITGGNNFAWSENIGWIDFDGVTVNTVGNEKRLSGQARIIAIRDAGATNAGGWQGWIKMAADGGNWNNVHNECRENNPNRYENNEPCNYGVKIDRNTGQFSGYAWNGEVAGIGGNMANGLGWINFSRASLAVTYSLSLYPNPLDIRSNPTTLFAKITSSGGVEGKTISFSKTGSNKINLPATPSCTTDEFGECSIDLTATNFTTDETATITGTCTGGPTCSATSTVNIIRIPDCTLNCPSEIILSPDQQNKSVLAEIDITGDPECVSSFITCSESGTDANGNIGVSGDCKVSETGNLRYGSSQLTATGGDDTCTAPISVRGAGWIETTP